MIYRSRRWLWCWKTWKEKGHWPSTNNSQKKRRRRGKWQRRRSRIMGKEKLDGKTNVYAKYFFNAPPPSPPLKKGWKTWVLWIYVYPYRVSMYMCIYGSMCILAKLKFFKPCVWLLATPYTPKLDFYISLQWWRKQTSLPHSQCTMATQLEWCIRPACKLYMFKI